MTNWTAAGTQWLNAPFAGLLATGQTTQYSGEPDDGYHEIGIAKSYTVLSTGAYSGTSNIDLQHYSGADVSFDSASKEIRSTGNCGVFLAAGADTVIVSGSGSNDGTFTSTSATADKIVVSEAVSDEAAGATVTLKKREAKSNNCVQDNNTGLMWSRYVSDKMGTASDGQMPWTGKDYDIFQYCAVCNTASLAGYTDWRVANLLEMISIDDFGGQVGPNATAFPSWPAYLSYIWVSTTWAPSSGSAWRNRVGYDYVGASAQPKTMEYLVALIRGGI